MTSTSDEDFDTKLIHACETAEKFCEIYYDAVDKKRHLIQKLYLETAVMVWNGNFVSGNSEIVKFFESLPPSEHVPETLDCQPLIDHLSPGKLTIIATVSGSSKYKNNRATTFMQSFTLTSINNVLKIVSDTVRFLE